MAIGDDEDLLADSVARFVRERCGPERQRAWREGEGVAAAWREIAALGWIGIAVPEEAGGLGGTARDEASVAAGIGRGLLPVAYATGAVMATDLLRHCPTGGDLLAGIVSGERICAVADEEPGRAFGAAPVTELVPHGGRFRLSGRKSLVLGLAEADDVLVPTRDAETGATILVRVDARSEALVRREVVLLDGRRASDLTFSVELGPDALLLRGNGADVALASARSRAALACAAEAVGAMQGAIDVTREHLSTRQQFGRALAEFQALRHRFADMLIEFEMARSAVAAAVASLGDGAVGRSRMASVAKVKAASAGRAIGEAAVQLHGGLGLSAECAAGQFYKRLLVLDTLAGTGEEHLALLSEDYVAAPD